MWNIQLESEILKEILPNWEQFLFSNNIYWPIQMTNRSFTPQERRVQVTCGRILISKLFLERSPKDKNPQVTLDLKEFDRLKNNWLSNWRLKVSKELSVRINEWSRVILDLKSEISKAEFTNRVQVRLMIDLLIRELNEDEKVNFLNVVNGLDNKFRYLTFDNGFLWEEEQIYIFPHEEFWYLYRDLK